MAQGEVLEFLKKNYPKEYSSFQIEEIFKISHGSATTNLYKLWHDGFVSRRSIKKLYHDIYFYKYKKVKYLAK